MGVASRSLVVGLFFLVSCGRMPEEEKFVEAQVAGARAGNTPAYQFPESIHDETKEAEATIKQSTSYKMEKPGFGVQTESCFNGTLAGPSGDRPLAVVVTRKGAPKIVEMSVKRPCTCKRKNSNVPGAGDCFLTNPR